MRRNLFKKAAIFMLASSIVCNSINFTALANQSTAFEISEDTNTAETEQVIQDSSSIENNENSSENAEVTSSENTQDTKAQDTNTQDTNTQDTSTQGTTSPETTSEDTTLPDTTLPDTSLQDSTTLENTEEIVATEDISDLNNTEATKEEISDTTQAEDEEVICSTGYIEDDFVIPSISETFDTTTYAADTASSDTVTTAFSNTSTYEANNAGEIPTSYSFKDNLPAVREQGNWGVCWSFAAVGAAEASIISKGLADKTINLSELQLAYFFYHTVADPLGNTTSDKTEALGNNYLNVGGNSVFTTFALASWTGVADETKAPYSTASISGTLDNSLAYEDDYHMQNAYWINLSTDVAEVKKMIMEHGAVASAFYTDQSTTTASTACYNPTTYAYYYDGSYTTNHAITIVGWNDNYSIDNFNSSKKPSSAGAWLVRNSWGSTLGDEGYFWISYEDTAFTNVSYSKAFVFDFESANNYDHNYQYDGASGTNGYAVSSGGSIANVFTASGNSQGVGEQLDAVSFALYDVNVDYSIQIYTNLTDETNPTSGATALATPQTGSTSYVGYYTVPLEQSVKIDKGEKFSVVVTLSKSNGATPYFFGDKSYPNGDWIKFTNTTSTGQSFRKYSTSSNWYDMNSSGVTARIKAFTSDLSTPIIEETIIDATGIGLSENTLNVNTGQSLTLTATVLPENTTDKSIIWSTSDSNVATVDSNGLVNAVAAGTATITTKTNNNISAACLVTVTNQQQAPVILVTTGITLDSSNLSLKTGEKSTIVATVSPCNATDSSVIWSTSNSNVASVNSNGEITATGIGTVTITASTNNGIVASSTIVVGIGKTTNLIAKSQTTNSIKLVWDKQNGVSGYAIYRYNSTKKKYVRIATITKASTITYTDRKKRIGAKYKYKVRAYVKINKKIVFGAYSSILSTATKTAKPVLTLSTSKKKAYINWKKISGASGYEIIMSTKKTTGYEKIKVITKGKTVKYTKTKLKKGKKYYFKIRAYKLVNGVKIYSYYTKASSIKIK